MKALSAALSSPLELQAQGVLEKYPDFIGLWEQWASRGPSAFLESAGPLLDAGRWLILAGAPEAEFFQGQGQTWWKDSSGSRPAPFDFWGFAEQAAPSRPSFSPLPFCLSSSWFGALSYDFGKASALRQGSQGDFHFFKPSQVVAVDRVTKEFFLLGREAFDPWRWDGVARRSFEVEGLKPRMGLKAYESMARRAQGYIAQGDIYQANLAQAFDARWKGNAGSLYRSLREINPGPFMGLFKGPGFTLVSSSPERLVCGFGDRLETNPIAGTRPRGADGTEDLRLKVELKTNPKEQAEHLMLVDLARNDLGRVSRYGTVEVTRYAEIESYARVHHLVSTVISRKASPATASEVLQSLFPGGTITGCPKIHCMEIIEELEGGSRGFYTGSMGYLAPGPCFDFNILIRSFTLLDSGFLEFHAGAGIVADSDPRREYLETLYKVEALAQALGTTLLKGLP